MTPDPVPTSTEAELESFRQKWREEVSARAKGTAPLAPSRNPAASSSKTHSTKAKAPDALPPTHARQRSIDHDDDSTHYEYQNLGGKQFGRRLDETSRHNTTAAGTAAQAESGDATSALEHYEQAVEKEFQGSLGDSVNLYRKAFKLDSKVHETYKAKHYPPSYFKKHARAPSSATAPGSASTASDASPSIAKTNNPNPSNASPTVPNPAHHSLQGLSSSLQALISDFSSLSIVGEPPPTDLSPAPPCPIAIMPEEILVEVLEQLAVQDIGSFVRLAQVCKRLAFLVVTEERVWKRIALGHEYGFAAMHYTWSCRVDGRPLGDDDEGGFVLGSGTDTPSDTEDFDPPAILLPPLTTLTQMLVPSTYPSHRALFRQRPRIRFNGCYISTVNYTRPGQPSPTSVSWNSPIHIVTYYRYLRFLRDGTCISLLTTSEPADVVPFLWVEHIHKHHGTLPSAPMKDAVLGRWRLTGPEMPGQSISSSDGGEAGRRVVAGSGEAEGTLIVETAGAAPKYMNKMVLTVGSAGRTAKNNKLSWQGYWSYNRLTDDWAEFLLKNDRNRGFFWSRVKSYGMAWDESGMKE